MFFAYMENMLKKSPLNPNEVSVKPHLLQWPNKVYMYSPTPAYLTGCSLLNSGSKTKFTVHCLYYEVSLGLSPAGIREKQAQAGVDSEL